MPALLIPADPTDRVRVINLESAEKSLRHLQAAVGGLVDVQAHPEGDLWCHDEGRINGMPVNVRASHWVLNESTLAETGQAGEWSVLYGDVVLTGPPDHEGDVTPVREDMVEHFSAMVLSQEAMRDWDVRNVEWRVVEWDLGDDGGIER